MALFPRIPAREHDKFVEDGRDGGTDVRSAVGITTTTQASAVADDEFVLLSVSPHGEVYLASHDYTTQSDRIAEVDPIPEKYEYFTLQSGTSVAEDTEYTLYIPMVGYSRLDMQVVVSSGALIINVFGTIQADGTAPASLNYMDVGSILYDSYVSEIYDWSLSMFLDEGRNAGAFNYVKVFVKVGVGPSTFNIYCKKWWV